MKGFAGFSSGRQPLTRVPNAFFSALLPSIDNLNELKLTLHIFWRLTLKEGDVRFVRRSELLADETLAASLGTTLSDPDTVAERVGDALERATARGTLLHVVIEGAAGPDDYYLVNSERGQAAVRGIRSGNWRPGGDDGAAIDVRVERPNLFTLYEQNIGPLSPLITDELRDAEATFPDAWFEPAIKAAVENNARSWRYVRTILERWQQEGRQDRGKDIGDTEKDRRRYLDWYDS